MERTTAITIIQFILAPVVMVTACGLILNSLTSRYTTVTNRLRSLSRERFELLRRPEQLDAYFDFNQERIQQIEVQLPDLLRHHTTLHHSLLRIYLAIATFLFSMFVLAAAALTQWFWLEAIALIVFLAGIFFLFLSILLTALDFRQSHQVTQREARRICGLVPMIAPEQKAD